MDPWLTCGHHHKIFMDLRGGDILKFLHRINELHENILHHIDILLLGFGGVTKQSFRSWWRSPLHGSLWRWRRLEMPFLASTITGYLQNKRQIKYGNWWLTYWQLHNLKHWSETQFENGPRSLACARVNGSSTCPGA